MRHISESEVLMKEGKKFIGALLICIALIVSPSLRRVDGVVATDEAREEAKPGETLRYVLYLTEKFSPLQAKEGKETTQQSQEKESPLSALIGKLLDVYIQVCGISSRGEYEIKIRKVDQLSVEYDVEEQEMIPTNIGIFPVSYEPSRPIKKRTHKCPFVQSRELPSWTPGTKIAPEEIETVEEEHYPEGKVVEEGMYPYTSFAMELEEEEEISKISGRIIGGMEWTPRLPIFWLRIPPMKLGEEIKIEWKPLSLMKLAPVYATVRFEGVYEVGNRRLVLYKVNIPDPQSTFRLYYDPDLKKFTKIEGEFSPFLPPPEHMPKEIREEMEKQRSNLKKEWIKNELISAK